MKIYAGIDPGLTGAISFIDHQLNLIGSIPIPTQVTARRDEIDIRTMFEKIEDIRSGDDWNLTFILEWPGGSQNALAAASMAGSFHALRSMLDLNHWRYIRVAPQTWQKSLLGKVPKGDTKKAALTAFRGLFPEVDVKSLHTRKEYREGIVDAALIATYGAKIGL